MIGIFRLIIFDPVAAVTIARSPFIDVVDVAGRASLRGMGTGECVDCSVVERALSP